ncbi:TetR family transcriptional regulator [uncultured Amnibacterium sp.]|uniref:TetR family transcriptional regulator n=1 Tax=uncultured Amnibacterium sp. TaxID=1631851 RepID=UPI0035C9ACF4
MSSTAGMLRIDPAEPDVVSKAQRAQAETVARLSTAAIELFEGQGFEATTVDEITQRAGVSRRTFFRYFPTKEDVLFAGHADQVVRLERQLDLRSDSPASCAADALRVLVSEIADDPRALRYGRVVGTTPALQDREILWFAEYQSRIGAYLAEFETSVRGERFAHILAGALLAAVRQTLAAWGSGAVREPVALFVELADDVVESMAPGGPAASTGPTSAAPGTVVVTTNLSPAQIARLIEGAEQ